MANESLQATGDVSDVFENISKIIIDLSSPYLSLYLAVVACVNDPLKFSQFI